MTAPRLPRPKASLRDDVLVSVCFGDLPADAAHFDAVATMAQALDERFRFREIILIAAESEQQAFLSLVERVDNLRLYSVHDQTAFYQKRVIAAEEAIGDVVLLASANELASIDPVGMILRAADEQRVVLAKRNADIASRGLSAPLVMLGRAAGFQVSLRNLQTLAVPRTILNQLLSHTDPDLALRFPPRDVRVPLTFSNISLDRPVPRDAGFRRRLALLQKLLVYLAPSVLMAVTLTSALLALMGFVYALYVLGVWIQLDDVAPGWLTLSAMLSMTAFFLGISIMGLSLGMQQLLARTNRHHFDATATEVNRIDLFGQVASDLNVELERDRYDSQEHPT